MGWLILKMAVYLIIALVIGFIIGYWWRGRSASSAKDTASCPDHSKLEADLASAQAARDKTHAELAECKALHKDKDAEILRLREMGNASGGAADKPGVLQVDGPFGDPDDLKRISGVGPVLEKMLNDLNIYHFWQVASFEPQDVDWVSDNLTSFKGRIKRDNWVDQAKALHKDKHGDAYTEARKRHLG